MPKKKKTKSKRTTSKIATAKRTKNSSAAKQAQLRKKAMKKKQSKKKSSSRIVPSRNFRRAAQRLESSRAREGAISDRQAGDLEGLSRAQQADSESVDELVDEGNVFEAGAVAGVEAADDEDTKEVQTREFPEDDVPEEYLDKD